jgi:undecaprenyl-diphosphatase
MLNFLQAIILGFVEGVTEFLPISSTGHLILVSRLLHLQPTEFLKTLEIAIQLGAILAVVVLYWKTLTSRFDIWGRVLTAFVPTAIIGFLFYGLVKKTLLGSEVVVLWAMLIGGLALLVFEFLYREDRGRISDLKTISYPQAFLIGLFQAIAIIPGVSRAAATIVGGLALGISRKTIVQFSFLLAVPTIFAATGLDLLKSHIAFTAHELLLLLTAGGVAFLIALGTIKLFLGFLHNHTFMPFGVYRIIVASLLAFWFFF